MDHAGHIHIIQYSEAQKLLFTGEILDDALIDQIAAKLQLNHFFSS